MFCYKNLIESGIKLATVLKKVFDSESRHNEKYLRK